MQSDFRKPMNIGSDRLVTINRLADIIMEITGKKLEKVYELDKPQGVRGRNSTYTLIRKVLNRSPEIPLEVGLEKTYIWIKSPVESYVELMLSCTT